MLKYLQQITKLGETFAHWHQDYKRKLGPLLVIINDRFKDCPELQQYLIKATESGELNIKNLYSTLDPHSGHITTEQITISPESLILIAEMLKEGIL